MTLNKTSVLVTGVGGRSVGSGILHALLRTDSVIRKRWHVIGVDANPFSWGLYVADEKLIVPLAGDLKYLSCIKNIIEKYNVQAIIPGTEIENAILTSHRDEISVPVIANRTELMPLMMDKTILEAKLEELDLPYVRSYSLVEYEEAIEKYGYPLVIKPSTNSGGSRNLHLVTDISDMEQVFTAKGNVSDLMLLPYLGDVDTEYTVGVLSDKKGKVIDSIVVRRKLIGLSMLESKIHENREVGVSTGYSQGFIVKNVEIQNFCENVARKINSCGPLNIQLRIHQGEIYIFEIHPRFSGTTPIRASVGFNEVDILLRNFLFDKEFGRLEYKYDVAAIRAFEHVIVPIGNMPKGLA